MKLQGHCRACGSAVPYGRGGVQLYILPAPVGCVVICDDCKPVVFSGLATILTRLRNPVTKRERRSSTPALPGNVWHLPYRTIQQRATDRPHPATFPEALAERCLRLHGLERIRLACDPFLGIGTSAVVCQRLGVPFLGWEIDPDYVALARTRLGVGE